MPSLPKYLHLRSSTYYVRRPIPPDLQSAFGKKELWISLGTTVRKDAEAKSHGVLADLEGAFEAQRGHLDADRAEGEFLASPTFDGVLETTARLALELHVGGGSYAPASKSEAEVRPVAPTMLPSVLQPRPTSREQALGELDRIIDELDEKAVTATLVTGKDEDGGPIFGVAERYIAPVMAYIQELVDADKRTLEAQRQLIAGAAASTSCTPVGSVSSASLTALTAQWVAERKPAQSTQADMRTVIARFERVNGALGFADITDEHARRFKADLIADASIKNGTKKKLWGMLGALLSVAVNDRLVEANPFARVKLALNDDSAAREVLTSDDLAKVFGKLPPEEWWIARIGLYSGARLGEICQLTKGDIQIIGGVACFNIRPDAEAGKSVKTRSSIRKVPIHQQLLADGLLEWIRERPGDRLFTFDRAAASKRLNRRMRDAGMGKGKVFHSFRHTFKGMARRHMGQEWHDQLTGHATATIGQDYGDYDLYTLKQKLDLINFTIRS